MSQLFVYFFTSQVDQWAVKRRKPSPQLRTFVYCICYTKKNTVPPSFPYVMYVL